MDGGFVGLGLGRSDGSQEGRLDGTIVGDVLGLREGRPDGSIGRLVGCSDSKEKR